MSSSSESSSSSASSSRSNSPELPVNTTLSKKHTSIHNESTATDPVTGARNEGENVHWKLAPPTGAKLAEHSADPAEFDWDAVNDEDVEVWLIRAPSSLRPKYLEEMQLDTLSRTTKRTSKAGRMSRRDSNYDVWSVGENTEDNLEGDQAVAAAGDEMKGLSCLFPRKSKRGKLYAAPKAITRRLVVTAQHAHPTPLEDGNGVIQLEVLMQNPPRPSYPEDVLKHKFMPYGSVSGTSDGVSHSITATVDIDDPIDTSSKKKPKGKGGEKADATGDAPGNSTEPPLEKQKKHKSKKTGEETQEKPKEKVGKKRKDLEGKDVITPVKTKKVKVAS